MKHCFTFLAMSFFLCFSLITSEKAFSQTDTEFWFVAPQVSYGSVYGASGFNRPIVLRISTTGLASTVTITQPANGAFVPRIVVIGANSEATVDLTADTATIQNFPPDNVNNFGLKITATNPVSMYYEVVSLGCAGCDPEIFTLKGRNSLGTAFYTPFQNVLINGTEYVPNPFSAFDIVATQDNTTVTITPTQAIVGHPAGITFNKILNTGQTYSAQAASQSAAGHLTGSKVTSDKPIAITIKDDLARGGDLYGGDCDDLIGDQIIPVSRFGTDYAVVRGQLNPVAPEKAFIVASQDNTVINVAGVNVATINTGQTYTADISVPAVYITTSKPTILLHMSGIACETAGAILPGLSCNGFAAGSSAVSFVRSTDQPFFVNILTTSGGVNNFLYNGLAGIINAVDFSVVPNTGGVWYYARIPLSTAILLTGSSGRISNTAAVFQLGILHGDIATGVRYGYISDFPSCISIPYTATVTKTDVKCFGGTDGTATVTVSGGKAPYTYTLSGVPGGPVTLPITAMLPTISNLAANNYGLFVTDASMAVTPVVNFTIAQPSSPLSVAFSNLQNVNCTTGAKGSVLITATGGTAPYTGDGLKSNLAGGTYTFTVSDANNCSKQITVTIIDNCVCTNTVQHTETFPNQYNTGFTRSLVNKTFIGSSGTWTANSNANATIVVLQPYYSPSTSYALKIVNFKTYGCSGTGTCSAASPKINLVGACCPAELKLNLTLWTYNVVAGDTKADLSLDFSNDNGVTWNEVWSQTSAQLFSSYGANGKTNISVPVPVSYQNANFRYRFRGEMAANDNNNFYLFIDDISIKSPATCAPQTGSIGNYVWYDVNGNGVQDACESGKQGVTVKLTYPNATTATQTTDVNGAYLFTNLAAGTYTVTFTTPVGFVASPANQGGNDATDSDPVSGVVSVPLAAGQNNTSVDAGFDLPPCTNTTQHTETFPNQYNTGFTRSLSNKTFAGSSGTWTANSNANATIVVIQPYYSPSTSYALKIVNFKTQGCNGSGTASAYSPTINLSNPCCPSALTLNLTLWTYNVYASDSKASIHLDFSNNNGSTWTEVVSATSSQLFNAYGSNGKATVSIPVPVAYQTANFRYRFRGEMDSNDPYNFFLFIDDINIKSPASCSSTPCANSTAALNAPVGIANSPTLINQNQLINTMPGMENPVTPNNAPVIVNRLPEVITLPSTIQVAPNPAFGNFNVALNNFKAFKAEVLLMSEKGIVIEKQSVQLSGKQYITNFNVKNLAAGVYYIKVVSEDGVQNAKVIIMH